MKKTEKLSRWLLILIVFEVLLLLYCLFFAREILIEEGLFFVVEAKHIKAVSRNVMRGRTECHQPKECQSELHIVWSRDKKGNTGETGSNQTLHGNNPGTLCLDQIYERTP